MARPIEIPESDIGDLLISHWQDGDFNVRKLPTPQLRCDATELVMYRMMNNIVSFHGVRSELRFLPAFIEPQLGTHICMYV